MVASDRISNASRPGGSITRRAIIAAAGAAAGSAAALASGPVFSATAPSKRRRYAIVGTGHRGSGMWGEGVSKRYSDVLEFVGLCDVNPKRALAARQRIGVSCPTFSSFDEMCDKTKPELLTVTTVDGFHSEYIVKALDRGIDVLTEKPMTIDERQCQAVLDAEKRNNRKITVAFNYRYAPKHQKIKEVLLSGAIGKIVSVDFHWYLDTDHGADYFRRWHRLRNRSGTLFVHKATHHFDLVNWWLAADPVEVTAAASLRVYGKNGPFRASHCRACSHTQACSFYSDITKDPEKMLLYASCESVDGYHRDGCVYSEDIDIYDTMSALIQYSNGVTMSYSVNAFLPYEGYSISFNGERGRLDVRDYERQPWAVERETDIYLTKSFGKRERIDVPMPAGDHGGGDDRLRDVLFHNMSVPEYMRLPDSRAGAMSCLTGIAARKSVELGRTIKVPDLVRL
ncbi:MAG TPA: Gfo/Idh/MocA family oxidoreductase [Polyangiaceae bacterium]